MRHVVIMAGGSGRRFWPVSRETYPKQFLVLYGNRTLLQHTYHRAQRVVAQRNIWISTRAGLEAIIRNQVPILGKDRLIIEPVGRDTAPSIALSCSWIMRADPRATIMFLPADHYVNPATRFAETALAALSVAEKGDSIVTIGIQPTFPSIGYGYMQCDMKHVSKGFGAHPVLRFREKPDLPTARRYLKRRRYFWNSGIFIARASVLMEELEKYAPRIFALTKGLMGLTRSAFQKRVKATFRRMPKISFDYAVMEKSKVTLMVPARFSWNDLGSWSSLEQLTRLRKKKNVSLGRVLTLGSDGNIVSSREKLTVLIDAKDLVVAVADDAVLVCDKHSAQKVKDAVVYLRKGRHVSYT